MTPAEGAIMRPGSSGSLTCQGWGASRGIKGGSAPLARSYRGPDNVAGPLLGLLNPALAVVSFFEAGRVGLMAHLLSNTILKCLRTRGQQDIQRLLTGS